MAVEAFLMLSSLQKLAAGNPGAATISMHIFGLRCSSRRGRDSLPPGHPRRFYVGLRTRRLTLMIRDSPTWSTVHWVI